MKCPRCVWELRGAEQGRKARAGADRLAVCDACGWKSATYEQLIERSPEYRAAKLNVLSDLASMTARAEKAEAEAHRAQLFIASIYSHIAAGLRDERKANARIMEVANE
jgi:transcriptional regulator NrdR family protein